MTAEKQKVQLISTIEAPSNKPERVGKSDYFITYQVDPLHRYTLQIPAEGLTTDKVDALVRADYMKRKDFINREITVG